MDLILYALDFNLLCIILYAAAVLLAKRKKAPWILLGIGAFIEIIGFIGGFVTKIAGAGQMTASIILFVILTALAVLLIRRRKAESTEE